jgi:hypothetical protein
VGEVDLSPQGASAVRLALKVARVRKLIDQWREAERAADDYGPGCAYTGNDCAEMLEEALEDRR